MNNKETEIFVFYYKPVAFIPEYEEYTPVYVGKNSRPEIKNYTGDDTGLNISAKNKYYSELTGLYWVWKNKRPAIVGSCHYRRYFTIFNEPFIYMLKRLSYFFAGIQKKRHGLIYSSDIKFWKNKFITATEINQILSQYDAIMPVRRVLKYSVEQHYHRYHNSSDLLLIKNIITGYFPEYIPTFDKIMTGKRLFANNMFIMPWELFDKLMNWLFFILFKFEEKTNLNDFKGYQQRIFGFLSERLITVWIEYNQIKTKELHLVYFKKFKTQNQ